MIQTEVKNGNIQNLKETLAHLYKELSDLSIVNKTKTYKECISVIKKLLKEKQVKYYCSKCNKKHIRGKIHSDHVDYGQPILDKLEITLPEFFKVNHTEIVGIYYQKKEWGVSSHRVFSSLKHQLSLDSEPDNEYDNYAISVWGESKGEEYKLGYLPSGENRKFFKLLEKGVKIKCFYEEYRSSGKYLTEKEERRRDKLMWEAEQYGDLDSYKEALYYDQGGSFKPERADVILEYARVEIFEKIIDGLKELDQLGVSYIIKNLEAFQIITTEIQNKNHAQWNPNAIYEKMRSGKELTWIEKNYPLKRIYFSDVNFEDKKSIRKYLNWNPTEIINKLKKNEYPDNYDLNHFYFIFTWRDIEKEVQKLKLDNDALKKFEEYLERRFSLKRDDGFKVLL